MMKKNLLIVLLLIIINGCTSTPTEDLFENTDIEINNVSGFLTISDQEFANSIGLSGSNLTWTLDANTTSIKSLLSRNLTSSPYKLELTIKVNDDAQSPSIKFISDFDRRITAGNRYKIITTLNLFGNNTFFPGNTGGQVTFSNSSSAYGFSIGSECNIVIAEEGSVAVNNSSQFITLKGTFTLDNTANIDKEIGSFVINFDGNNIIDLSFF